MKTALKKLSHRLKSVNISLFRKLVGACIFNRTLLLLALLITISVVFICLFAQPIISTAALCSTSTPSFVSQMETFDWSSFNDSVMANDSQKIEQYSDSLLMKLIPFIIESPPVPVNATCKPPPLRIPENCDKFSQPRKVGMLLQFGFDLDALEIHLHELDQVVDKFFLIESTIAHGELVKRKPLIWEKVKFEKRFSKFINKIVHFVVDDGAVVDIGSQIGNNWRSEVTQEKLRWIKFLKWNSMEKEFGPQDILGFGDADEIASRKTVFFLKNCKMPAMPVDIGIWFPYGGLNTTFATDFPVQNNRFSLGDPTFWSLEVAIDSYQRQAKFPNRMRGRSPTYLLGGLHLSRYPYPPFMMMKMLTGSESNITKLKFIIEIGQNYVQKDYRKVDEKLNHIESQFLSRIYNFSSLGSDEMDAVSELIQIPWFYQCNRNRYPSLEGKYDARLIGGAKKLQKV